MATQEQQQSLSSYNREEEYLAAQRSANESLDIGRATLEQAHQQHEQLHRATALADETGYTLDKAGRVLRGMTWSGWMANKFSRPVAAPSANTLQTAAHNRQSRDPPEVYEDVPPVCQEAAQAIQNYHANTKVLKACSPQDAEQRETLMLICDNMFLAARKALDQIPATAEAYRLELAADLSTLRCRQRPGEAHNVSNPNNGSGNVEIPKNNPSAASLFPTTSASRNNNSTQKQKRLSMSPEDEKIRMQQDEHLNIISQNLGELGSIAQTLQQSLQGQDETINRLDTMSENIVEKTQMVTRRTDRMIQNKSWTPTKPTLDRVVSIRHLGTGRYLSVTDGKVQLVPIYHPETCVFGLWRRQGRIFGLKNKYQGKWLGQNMFGSLVCSSWNFGRREEWENIADGTKKADSNDDDESSSGDDGNWDSTRLLCASAGWGAGGYLQVRTTGAETATPVHTLTIGGLGTEERQKADVFRIQEIG